MEPVKTPKRRQRKKEADHEQEHEHMKGHNDPRCLKWGAWRAPVEARLRRVYSTVKRLGEMSELSTTERGSTYLKLDYKRLEPICVGNVTCLDSNLTANLTHVSMNPPVQKSFPGVRSQGSTRAPLLSDTSIQGTNTLRTRKQAG
jgi:hypothetical protein